MKFKIELQIKDELVKEDEFDFGYYEGRYATKRWIIQSKDIQVMYSKFEIGEIHLWCDILKEENDQPVKKKKKENNMTKRQQEKEEKIENVFDELCRKHTGEQYTTPQLKLWAIMSINGLHVDYDCPPNIPMITGAVKTHKKESLSEAISSAAAAFANVIKPANTFSAETSSSEQNTSAVNKSPGKHADARMKNLEQLRYLQQLHLDKILTEEEFKEQKGIILNTLRTL